MSFLSRLMRRERKRREPPVDWAPAEDFGPSRRHLLPAFLGLAGAAALSTRARADVAGLMPPPIGVPGGAAKLDMLGDLDPTTTNRALGSGYSRRLAARAADRINVKDLGAIGDGTVHQLSERFATLAAAQAVYPAATALTQSIDSCAIQRAIDLLAAATNPGGEVYAPVGIYVCDPITLRDRVILAGDSITSTVFQLRAGSNADFFTSAGFAGFTGQNKWLPSDGVPGWLGFRKCRIDGNKANQTAGNGLSAYARGLVIDEVIIHACYGAGIYSECGTNATITDWYALCEGNAGPLWIWNCGGIGWQMRGPHDQRISHLVIALCGGDGMRVESSSGVYGGTCDIGFAHIYANGGYGFYCTASQFRAQQLISESNQNCGVYIKANYCQINNLQAYNNNRSTAGFGVVFDTTSVGNVIANASITQPALGSGCLQVGGQQNIVVGLIDGIASGSGSQGTGVGCDVYGTQNKVTAQIRDFAGTGGIGLRVNYSGTGQYNEVDATIILCSTLINNYAFGNNNEYRIRGYCDLTKSQVPVSGAGAPNNNPGVAEVWDVIIKKSDGTTLFSRSRLQNGTALNLNSVAEQTFTFTHNLLYTPRVESCALSIVYTGSDTAWSVGYMRIVGTSSTTVTATVKLATAASAASQTATLCLTAEL